MEAREAHPGLDDDVRRGLEARIHAVAGDIAGEAAVHDLMLAETGSGLYLSCHCFVPADTSLAEAHALTERLERALRSSVPELTRIAVHAEPYGSRRHTAGRGDAPAT
jgi:divalent metal cation (Fe/Co/Zn/Cd) transporter